MSVWHPGERSKRTYGGGMTTVTRPRGPLPTRVYWTRRLLVVLLALGLVAGVAHLLGGGGGGTSPSARPVGAQQSASTWPGTLAPTASPTPTSRVATSAAPGKRRSTVSVPLAQPTGTCASSDIVAVPSVKTPAYAGRLVVLRATLTTRSSPACSWTVSAQSLVVKVTSGTDRIWSTQQCVGAVPKQSVVVRRAVPVSVSVTWDGQRSDAGCTRATPWVQPGYYHVAVAAYGATPADAQFRLLTPTPATVTATPSPTKTATPTAKPTAKKPAAKKPAAKKSAGKPGSTTKH